MKQYFLRSMAFFKRNCVILFIIGVKFQMLMLSLEIQRGRGFHCLFFLQNQRSWIRNKVTHFTSAFPYRATKRPGLPVCFAPTHVSNSMLNRAFSFQPDRHWAQRGALNYLESWPLSGTLWGQIAADKLWQFLQTYFWLSRSRNTIQ